MKNLIKAIKTKNVDLFLECLTTASDISKLSIAFKLRYLNSDILHITEKNKRKSRDDFFESIVLSINPNEKEVMDYIKNIKNIIGISEFLFDKISELLDNHELLHENVSIQIWNHIKFVEEKFSEVISDLEKNQLKNQYVIIQ